MRTNSLFITLLVSISIMATDSALTGHFSINTDGDQIVFSQGNLQFQASTNTWRFAENQYDRIGENNANINSSYNGWIDLFGWGTSGYNGKFPYMTSTTGTDYGEGELDISGTNYDWGIYNASQLGEDWHTMTLREWYYIIKTRQGAEQLRSHATVCDVVGYILLPDDFVLPQGVSWIAQANNCTINTYNAETWDKLEKAGAVFLPSAGGRYGIDILNVDSIGCYWSSSYGDVDHSGVLAIYNWGPYSANILRCEGLSVRLVRNITQSPCTIETDIYAQICHGEFYNFNKKIISENGGVYFDTLRTISGCDSIVKLHLSVNEPSIVPTVVHISDQETYVWTKHDLSTETLSQAGVYDDTLRSLVTGCDSINRLELYVHPTYIFNEAGETCEGEPYYWRGNLYSSPGEYYDSLTTEIYHVDSVYHLSLTINPVWHHDTTVYICEGDYYNFNGKPITTGGTYYDTLRTIQGCDSIFRLRVMVRPTITKPTSAIICWGDSYTWRGKIFTSAGNYMDTLHTADNLCDSIYYTLSLTVNPTYEMDTTLILCSGDYVVLNGRVYDRGGLYRDTLLTVNGCDSIYRILVYEYHPFFRTERVALCKDSTMVWRGKTINTAGTYYDSLTSSLLNNVCDSVYELIVTTQLPKYEIVSATILSTQYYSFGTHLLTQAGTYFDTLPAIVGSCDSIVELHLTVLPVYNIAYRDTICRGEKYNFNGKELENGGLYTDTLLSVYGTDSIVNLMLVVHEPRIYERTVHICDKETYEWHKHDGTTVILDRTGVYDDTLTSIVTGCDSINRLTLTVNPCNYSSQLQMININGNPVEGFAPDKYNYTFKFPAGTNPSWMPTVSNISWIQGDEYQTVNALQAGTSVILLVTAGNGLQRTYLLNFVVEQPNQFVVTTLSNNTDWGTAIGGNIYNAGVTVEIGAFAEDGYQFYAWNNTITENPYAFTLTQDTSFVALFLPDTPDGIVTDVTSNSVHMEWEIKPWGNHGYWVWIYVDRDHKHWYCKMRLNADGTLNKFYWGPASKHYNESEPNPAPHHLHRTLARHLTTSSVIAYDLTDIEAGLDYFYLFEMLDEQDNVTSAIVGSFSTEALDPTAIDEIDYTAPQKILYDGQIFIIRGEKTYTITGQQVQ